MEVGLEQRLVLHLDATSQGSFRMDGNAISQWHDTRATRRAGRFVAGAARLEHDAYGTPLVAPQGEGLKGGADDLNELLHLAAIILINLASRW